MTKDWKKSYSHVEISWLIPKYKTGDIACSIFFVNNLTAHAIEENLDRVLDKLKCAAKLKSPFGFAVKNIEAFREIQILLCSWEQHLVGTVKMCE